MSTPEVFAELDPPPRLLMGPGPVGVDPRVLRAMSMPMLGQFDPAFTAYMNETMVLLRQIYRTKNQWSFLIDGTARAGVETMLVSMISPGDKVLVPIFGRFGHLLTEIAGRCGAEVVSIEREWGTVFTPDEIEALIAATRAAYQEQLSAYYSTSELWDDGLIDPVDTRNALGMAISVSLNAPLGEPGYGVFRF